MKKTKGKGGGFRAAIKRNWAGYAFVSPWLIGFLAFTAGPFLASIFLSFTRYNVVSPPVWVGAANYNQLLTGDPIFWKSLVVTFKYAAVAIPLGIIVGVALALLLNMDLKGISVYRTLFYVPSIVPVVASSVVFMWILNPNGGLVNSILLRFGVIGPNWLQDKTWSLWSLVFMSLWGAGGSMIIYLAGLKDIPIQLYEAAMIDGAGPWKRTRHITLPMMTPIIFFNLVMGTIGAFQYFTQAFVMTAGGPEDSTMFYSLYLFNRAWKYLDMGYASAMAWILFVVIMVFTGILMKTQRRWVHYGD